MTINCDFIQFPFPITCHFSSLLSVLLFLSILIFCSSSNNGNPNKITLDQPFQASFQSLPHVPCVSLFHRQGRIGCSTMDRSRSKGMLLHWTTLYQSIQKENKNSIDPLNLPPFVAVMDDLEFNVSTLQTLRQLSSSSSSFHGILVLNAALRNTNDDNSKRDQLYNPASSSPQGQGTPSQYLHSNVNQNYYSGEYNWNTHGDGLLYQDLFGIPVAYVTTGVGGGGDTSDTTNLAISTELYRVSMEQSNQLLAWIRKNPNVSSESTDDSFWKQKTSLYPAIVAEFDLYMGPSDANSIMCLQWLDPSPEDERTSTSPSENYSQSIYWSPKCAPIGGNSVWASAGSPWSGSSSSSSSQNQQNAKNQNQPTLLLISTNMDSTSMFHDVSPGANTAASNLFVLLMTAKLVGTYVSDTILDSFPKKLIFTTFQGEMFGSIGSRSFFKDIAYPGFTCSTNEHIVRATLATTQKNKTMACLYPLRHDLTFTSLSSLDIDSMIALDQLGVLSTEDTFYIHESNQNNKQDQTPLAEIFMTLSNNQKNQNGNSWTIEQASSGAVPPSAPLLSLMDLSEGNKGGVVFAGYNNAFADTSYYLSHLDSNQTRPIDLQALAKAATFVARASVAAAIYDGSDSIENAVQYATNIIPALSVDDKSFVELANCLFVDGFCDLFLSYGRMQQANTLVETGVDLGIGTSLGKPPNYYPSIYDASNGQAFVQIDGRWYGSYKEGGSVYGQDKSDTFLIRPSLLEMSIHGMLNDYLGRGTIDSDSLKSCKSSLDCTDVSYCASNTDYAICSGSKVCVCSRAHYHHALDEAIVPSPNNSTGYFIFADSDSEISPLYTEPYWSSTIGVFIYRDTGKKAGNFALGFGFLVAVCSIYAAMHFKMRMKKEKLY